MITLLLIVAAVAVAVIIMIIEIKDEKFLQQKKREFEAEFEPLLQEEPSDVPGHLPPPLEEPYTPEEPVEPVLRRPGRPRKPIVTEVSPEAVPGRRSRKVH